MDTSNNEQILSLFIEEAKEHLSTLEQGIVNLPSVVTDAERLNEMFRAAHSMKGGAAMLALGSIQKTAHRLEDSFKILQEYQISVDEKLDTLFSRIYDVLQNLVTNLENNRFGVALSERNALSILEEAEPTFVELQDHLDQIVADGAASSSTTATPPTTLASQIKEILKQMLALFKQQQTPASRQQLQQLCDRLAELAPQIQNWQLLLKTAKTAIANPKHSYSTLAPVVIKELKQGSDLLEVERSEEIAPSPSLQQLAESKLPQILVTVEPQAVAASLRQVFNQQQLSQLVQLLHES